MRICGALRSMMLALPVALAGALPLAAQNAESLKRDMVGQWELSTTERNKTCIITLKPDGPLQAMKIELASDCAKSLPFTAAITGWSIRGLDIVRLQSAGGDAVLDFTEVESGLFEARRSGDGIYILQHLAAAREQARSMDHLIGDWSLMRGNGRQVCRMTLTNTESVPERFDLYLKPRCDAAVVSFAPIAWQLERGELRLISRSGDIWTFEADENAQWRRVPEGPEPILLVRQ